MMLSCHRVGALLLLLLLTISNAWADCPDTRRPDGPPLSQAGQHAVGIEDFMIETDAPDRSLELSVWYPTANNEGERVVYRDALGSGPGDPDRPVLPFEFCGLAFQSAPPVIDAGSLPTVLISHGFPGSNVLMAWLGEHLASHGFAAIGIGHTGATHADRGELPDVLVNKPADILRVIDAIDDEVIALEGVAFNAGRIGLVGYSMGGYAGLVAAGAALHPGISELPLMQGIDLTPWMSARLEPDERIAAVVGLAPWGGPEALERVGLAGLSLWPADSIAAVSSPLLLVSGDADLVSGYAGGARWIFEHGRQARWLLTYHQARHNVAPMPPPSVSREFLREFNHYAEPVWDIERLNDLNRHFILAFLQAKLMDDPEALRWLSSHDNGDPRPPGFGERDAIGFSLERRGGD